MDDVPVTPRFYFSFYTIKGHLFLHSFEISQYFWRIAGRRGTDCRGGRPGCSSETFPGLPGPEISPLLKDQSRDFWQKRSSRLVIKNMWIKEAVFLTPCVEDSHLPASRGWVRGLWRPLRSSAEWPRPASFEPLPSLSEKYQSKLISDSFFLRLTRVKGYRRFYILYSRLWPNASMDMGHVNERQSTGDAGTQWLLNNLNLLWDIC